MLRYAIALLVLTLPAQLFAGGPPRLYLPITGVTSETAQTESERLTAKLKDKIWPYEGRPRDVQIVQVGDAWYLTYYMGGDVRLSDIDAVLQGTKLSVSRDTLRVFGHVVLEIDVAEASRKELLQALGDMANVSVAESKTSNDLVAVTVDMPYPLWARAERDPEAVSFDTFSTGDLSTEPGSRTPVPADKLPTWTAFRDLVKQHDGTLKDIRWDDTFACRALGAISLRKTEKTASTR